MRSGARKIRTKFTAAGLTHFGGVYLFHQFLQQIRFRSYLARHLPYDQRNNRFSLSEIILALIYPMILGLEKIEVSALLKTNGVFQYLTGLPHFPDPTTLRRFLIRAPSDILPPLWKIHNNLRKYFITQPSYLLSYCIDFDSTANTLYGHQEGVVKGYNPGQSVKNPTIPSLLPKLISKMLSEDSFATAMPTRPRVLFLFFAIRSSYCPTLETSEPAPTLGSTRKNLSKSSIKTISGLPL